MNNICIYVQSMMEKRWTRSSRALTFLQIIAEVLNQAMPSGGVYVAEKTKFLWIKFSSYFKEHVLLLRRYYITEAFYYYDDLSVRLSELENLAINSDEHYFVNTVRYFKASGNCINDSRIIELAYCFSVLGLIHWLL